MTKELENQLKNIAEYHGIHENITNALKDAYFLGFNSKNMKHLVEITEHDTWSRNNNEVIAFRLFNTAKEARDYARKENDENDEPEAPETYYTAAYMGEVPDDYIGKKK